MDERGVAVVIEDDEDIRELLSALLAQSGFEVHTAARGVDGVRAVEERQPVIVTVDLGLPDIDGFEVTRRLRRITDAYILMLTARTEEIDTLMGLEAGADDYLTKPFRPRELRARIEALMRRPRTAAPTPVPPVASPQAPAAVPPVVPVSAPTPWAPPTPPMAEPGAEPTSEFAYRLDGLALYPGLYRVTVDEREVQLTPTEFILLKTLLASRRVVRSKTELFRIMRDEPFDAGTFVSEADERTIEVHMGNLRRKLGDDPRRPRWVETLRGIGYRSAGMPQSGS